MMPNGKLADPEALSMGQHRGEPVQLTIQPDVAYDVGPVDLEPAVEIMQWHA
jgi:hypothetical protein